MTVAQRWQTLQPASVPAHFDLLSASRPGSVSREVSFSRTKLLPVESHLLGLSPSSVHLY